MSGIYTTGEYEEGYPEGIERHFWHRARNAFLCRAARKVSVPGETLMDVGCGPGIFLKAMQGSDRMLLGVEQGTPRLLEGLSAQVLVGTDVFALDEAIRDQVNVLLLLDVLEHLENRAEFLQNLWRAFPNCHHLIVTVPARRELWSGFDEYWGHQLRYDRNTLIAELEAGGCVPQRTVYFFNWLYLVSLLLKLTGLRRSHDFSPPASTPLRAFMHSVLGLFTRLETRLMPGFVVGSSLLCVAKRSAALEGA